MGRCQHCGQGAIAKDKNGPVCPDCWEEGYYETDNPMTNETEAPDLFSPYHDGSMQHDKDGGWVSIDDYNALSDAKDARIAELEAERDAVAARLERALVTGSLNLARAEAAEAKLANAMAVVDAAESIMCDPSWGLDHKTYMNLRRALKKLKESEA